MRFDIHARRVLDGSVQTRDAQQVEALVARLIAELEAFVRLAPDQYNWLHRRWKSRPYG